MHSASVRYRSCLRERSGSSNNKIQAVVDLGEIEDAQRGRLPHLHFDIAELRVLAALDLGGLRAQTLFEQIEGEQPHPDDARL